MTRPSHPSSATRNRRRTRTSPREVSRSSNRGLTRDIYTGAWTGHDAVGRAAGQPLDIKEELEAASKAAYNRYVRTVIKLKCAFATYGCSIMAPAGASKATQKRIERWAHDRRAYLLECMETAWRDRYVYDNVVAFWVDGGAEPMLLPPERCEYRDPFGKEMLKYKPGWAERDVGLLDDDSLVQRWRKGGGWLTLGEDPSEHFKVLKWERVGCGFGRPTLAAEISTLDQCTSMEVGENALGFMSRTPIRQHALGHEIKSGPHAGQPRHFIKKARAEAIKSELNGKTGMVEMATNFDHKILVSYPDASLFDARKWHTIRDRIAWWAGPLGVMLTGGPLLSMPTLMGMFREEVHQDRTRMGPFLEEALSANAPDEISIRWGNQCFQDMRVWSELLKYGVQQGPISNHTFLEETGRDADREIEHKKDEIKERSIWMPTYSGAHGKVPVESGGRPVGTVDPPQT